MVECEGHGDEGYHERTEGEDSGAPGRKEGECHASITGIGWGESAVNLIRDSLRERTPQG